jgi:uncharacterized protein (TIGR03437 family)
MGGVQVFFLPQNIPAPLLYVSAGQINAVVPYEIAQIASSLAVEVKYLGQTSNAFPISQAATAPGIYTANSSGTGQAAVIQYDSKGNYQGYNSVTNPATHGWYLVLYMTGEGYLNPPVTKDGAVTAITEEPLVQPSVLVDNQAATVAAYQEAPGYVSGIMQINAIVPQNTTHTGAVLVSVSMGTTASQAGVTVYLQ